MVPHSIAGSAVVALQGLGMGLVTHVHYGQAIGVGRIHRGMGWDGSPSPVGESPSGPRQALIWKQGAALQGAGSRFIAMSEGCI